MATSPGKKPAAAAQRRNREADVIAAAIEVFHKKGYAAASIQDVADRVGVLKGSLYYYIDSKEDLLFRIFDESHRQATLIIDEVSALEEPALERLRIYFERYILWYLRNLERVGVYFHEWRYLTGESRKTIVHQRHVYEQFVIDLIDAAKREGDIDENLDSKYASFFVLGAANGAPQWYRKGRGDSAEHIASVYASMVIGTLSGTDPPARS